MPVPWDAMLPCGIILAFYTVIGQIQYHGGHLLNEGKNPRIQMDQWGQMMMARDRSITQHYRLQSTNPEAKPDFAAVDSQSTLWRLQ